MVHLIVFVIKRHYFLRKFSGFKIFCSVYYLNFLTAYVHNPMKLLCIWNLQTATLSLRNFEKYLWVGSLFNLILKLVALITFCEIQSCHYYLLHNYQREFLYHTENCRELLKQISFLSILCSHGVYWIFRTIIKLKGLMQNNGQNAVLLIPRKFIITVYYTSSKFARCFHNRVWHETLSISCRHNEIGISQRRSIA